MAPLRLFGPVRSVPPSPPPSTPKNVAGLFTAVFVGLMLLKDYSPRRLSLAGSTAPVIVPPAHAFTGRVDRLAA